MPTSSRGTCKCTLSAAVFQQHAVLLTTFLRAKELVKRRLEEAKTFGDVLVVTITPDEFVHKGPNRPAFTAELRLEALSALESIDFVSANEWPIAVETIKISNRIKSRPKR